MPVRRTSPRFRVEPLEDRVTPAVTAALNGTTLTVTLGAASDTATITGTTAGGTDLEVAGTGFTTQTFNGVNSLVVVDGGGNAGQAVTFADAGAGTAIQLPGAVTVNGIETVNVGTANGDLRALSVGIANATAINLTAGVTTTGPAGQVYGGPVVVGSATVTAVTLNAGAGGGVEFTQTVNGFAADADSLTVNAGSTTAPTRFGGLVGGSVRLDTLTTDAAGTTVFVGSVTTNGAQSYADPVTLASSQVTFTSVSAGISFLGTLNAQTVGAQGATVNAPLVTTFGGAVGGLAPLSTLNTDAAGTTQIGANVVTTSSQSYGDAVVVSGAAVQLVSTSNGAITFTGAVAGAVADTTALTVNTGGVTTFSTDVGGTRLLSLTTDAPGSTVIGTGGSTVAVSTSGAQTFNDAVRVNATTSVTFTSTANGAVLFGAGLNGTTAGTTAVAVNTGGTTTFNAAVGATVTLASLATDLPGTTVLGASVSTTGSQTYAEPVTVTPGTGVSLVMLTASAGSVSFGTTVTGATAIPFNVRAGGNVVLGANGVGPGDITLSGAGSSLTLQAGSSGTGQIVIPAGTTFRADAQAYRAGDGAGLLTTAAVDLHTNTPQLRNAAGTGAPVSFVLRQDESIADATLPNVSQFGGTFPRSIALVSDDGTLTLSSTAVAGAQTTDLLLSAAQALTVGTAINAPAATVRLRSASANVTQTAAGTITAGTLGVRAATGIDLTLAPNAATTVALQSTNGDVKYATATPATLGTVAADVLTAVFPVTAGGQTGTGNVTVTPFGTTALDLTVAAPLTGTAVGVTGGAGADRVTVNYSLGATLANGFTFTGGGGTDTLLLTDTGGATAHAYTIGATVVRDSGQPVNLPGVENLSVTGGDAADTFTVTPDADHTITVAGGSPTTGTGDALTVTLTGATTPVLSSTKTASGLQGTATFGNRQTLTFGAIETLTPSANVRVTASGPSSIGSGETGTLTVTVTNAGPSAVTGQSLVDNFPAGLTATWTAVASAGSSVAATSGTGNINTTADLAVNGTVTFTITLTASGGARGTLTNTFTAGSSASAFELDSTNNSATTTITTGPTDLVAVGAGPGGGPVVVVYNPDGTERFRRFAFDTAYSGGVTVATGDVNADGFEDIVAGSAVGASRVTVFDGRTGNELTTFFAFPGFTGGVNVAVAGGKVIAGAGVGGGPVVAVFTIGAGGAQEVNRFLAFDGNFRGGVQVGGSDRFLAVGAGPGGGPHVKLFDATTLAQTASFFAFPVGSTDGVTVAVGGTSTAPTLTVGSGIGSPPVAATFDAVTLNSLGSFQAFESSFRGGVRVAAGGIVNNKTTTVVAPGGGGSSRVRIVASDNTTVKDFFAFESAFTGGVYVG
ncbi:hypothetical protein J0H58_05855 [bacterium]|nr:hypothetical protein [bacterium]